MESLNSLFMSEVRGGDSGIGSMAVKVSLVGGTTPLIIRCGVIFIFFLIRIPSVISKNREDIFFNPFIFHFLFLPVALFRLDRLRLELSVWHSDEAACFFIELDFGVRSRSTKSFLKVLAATFLATTMKVVIFTGD